MAGLDWQSSLNHFSHGHILELHIWEGGAAGEQFCKGCIKPIANGMVYSCKSCNFNLHLSCAKIPQQMNHPAHNHVLNLLSRPRASPGVVCTCDACGQHMQHGFDFHCSLCDLDLHPSCSNLPMKFNHPQHPQHTLALSFTPPYPDKSFICDVCKIPGRGLWHYHCSECQYDSHVTCTQITSLRESLIDEFLENYTREIYQRGLTGGHIPMGNPHYMGRSYSEPPRYSAFPQPSMFNSSSSFHVQQQHLPPFPSAYVNGNHNMFRGSGMENIVENIVGGTSNNSDFLNMINPGGGGGNGGGPDILGSLHGLENFSSVIGSMFGFGFF